MQRYNEGYFVKLVAAGSLSYTCILPMTDFRGSLGEVGQVWCRCVIWFGVLTSSLKTYLVVDSYTIPVQT